MRRTVLVPVLFLAIACASSYTPRQNTRDDLVSYVERAAALVASNGPEAACTAFHEPRWMAGEWYVFVNRADDNVLVCHPARPDLVGGDQTNLQDVNGVYISREMKTRAEASGRGWVEYMWARPGETTPVRKSVYIVAVDAPDGKRYVVGSGGYEMP